MTEPKKPEGPYTQDYGTEDIAMLDQALAASRSDLRSLVDTARGFLADTGPDLAADRLIQGLLNQPAWDRLELATVLGVAVVELAEVAPGDDPEATS